MALLSFEQEWVRSEDSKPFSTVSLPQGWLAIWCQECTRPPDCPLLLVAMLLRTPAAWELRDAGAVNKWTCMEFEKETSDDSS